MSKMTEERLAELRTLLTSAYQEPEWGEINDIAHELFEYIEQLRAENERLTVLLGRALVYVDRLTAALDTIANDSDTAYMACSDLPACSGDSFKPETHNKECAVRIAYDALNPEPTA